MEGDVKGISSVVVIEDVLSTGASAIGVVDALHDNGLSVAGVAAILDYQISRDSLGRRSVCLRSLYTYDVLRSELEERGVAQASLAALGRWYRDLESDPGGAR